MTTTTTKIYSVGHNMPGYLPDDPDSVSRTLDFDEAMDALRERIEEAREGWAGSRECAQCDDALEFLAGDAAEAIRADGVSFTIGAQVYWIDVSTEAIDAEDAIRIGLAMQFSEPLAEIEPAGWDHYGLTVWDVAGEEYAVGDDDEADSAVAQAIEQSAWAFNAEFLADYTPIGIDADEIDAIRGDRYEDANDAILALIRAGCEGSLESFIEDATGADGHGHFLSSYDGEEVEFEPFGGGETLYAYRIN